MKRLKTFFHQILIFAYSTIQNFFRNPSIGLMALRTGIIGTITQSSDNITFSRWKNKNVMKRQRGPREGGPTTAQAANERKFALLVALSRILGSAFKVGLNAYTAAQTAYNAFIKYNYPNTTDNGSAAAIASSDIIVAKGSIPALTNFQAAQGSSAQEVDLSWDDNSNGTTALATDELHVAVLSEDQTLVQYGNSGVTRADASYTSAVNMVPAASTVNVYPFFVRADGSANSNNGYASVDTGA